ncbi:MAG: type IV toxin-antitoxin system AbiEi family antitoxin domain-containing protein [Clostridiales bacterium]|nr:type IV toxin-antitoxin system AbiEi family antitoxin domain-containing protein [Clostridiales bacterium]
MKQEDIVMSLLEKNNGYLTAKAAGEHGVSATTLKRMTERGLIERAVRGLYISIDLIPDPFFIAQYRCPQGVFSHETALYFNDLSDRTPFQLMMTIPSGWNTRLLADDDVMIFYNKAKYAKLGAAEAVTPYGRSVTIYDAERTLCDCLRNVDKLDKDLVLTALKRYMKDPAGDKAKLLEFAATFKIRDTVMRYMEVLS